MPDKVDRASGGKNPKPCIPVSICSLLKVLYEMQRSKILMMSAVPLSLQDSNPSNSDRVGRGDS